MNIKYLLITPVFLLSSFITLQAMNFPNAKKKLESSPCAKLFQLDPNAPKSVYQELLKTMGKQNTCECITQFRKNQKKANIDELNQELTKTFGPQSAITKDEYKKSIVFRQSDQQNHPVLINPQEAITYYPSKSDFSSELTKAIEDVYQEHELHIPLKVVHGPTTALQSVYNNRHDILKINEKMHEATYVEYKGSMLHELAGHSKASDCLWGGLLAIVIGKKIVDSSPINSPERESKVSHIVQKFDSLIVKEQEKSADQIPCACGSLSDAAAIKAMTKFHKEKFNNPESSTYPSCASRYNDAVRIYRLKQLEHLNTITSKARKNIFNMTHF